MEAIKNYWAKLPAKQKRQLVIIAGCLAGVLVLWQFLNVDQRERPAPVEGSTVSLTAEGTERFQMDVLVSRIRTMEQEQRDFLADLRRREREDRTQEEISELRESYQRQIASLEERMRQQRDEMSAEQRLSDEALAETIRLLEGEGAVAPATQRTRSNAQAPKHSSRPRTPTHEDLWGDSGQFQSPRGMKSGEGEQDIPKANIVVIESESVRTARQEDTDKARDRSQYIPAGTIISGTLITGLDAPTSQAARSEPHPALVRIKEESIMPNRFRGDLRECFMIVTGYGDLSTERAYLRTEALSCINSEGESMETRLESFAVGEDGSAGVRGRVVSKEGQLLAQSLKAGALSAFADVFTATPVPTIATHAESKTPFQSMLSRDAAQAGVLQGTGDALDRIAQYYLDVADMIFPVIEISAGREVDLIVNRGSRIDFRH